MFAQVVNSLMPKVKVIAIFAAKISIFSRSWIGLPSQFNVCNSYKLWKLAQGKFEVGQGKHRENTGNLKLQFEWVPWIIIAGRLSSSRSILNMLDYKMATEPL